MTDVFALGQQERYWLFSNGGLLLAYVTSTDALAAAIRLLNEGTYSRTKTYVEYAFPFEWDGDGYRCLTSEKLEIK